jgi:Tol biopolymer transport system component
LRSITHDARPKGTYATLATDGARVYFQESVAGRSFIAQVAASGGETSEISVALPVPTIYDLSSDGSELLLGALGSHGIEPWIQPLPGGSTRRVGEILANDGGWAPDGKSIVYTDGDSVYASNADGSDVKTLAKTGGAPAWPRVSPDGSRVRFTVFDAKRSSMTLWEVRRDGTGLHQLLAGWNANSNECCGKWTSDGKYFVFQSEREGATNLWAIREGEFWFLHSAPIQLTNGPLNFFAPTPNRDGKILFAIGRQEGSELVRYDVKTGAFTPYLPGISATQVRISPDGQWAAYISYPEGKLWRSAIDGSQRRQLTSGPMRAMWPHWSPEGKRVSFTGFESGKPPAMFVVAAEGGNLQRIGPESAIWLCWSPDGKSAVFNTLAPDAGPRKPTQIQSLDLETGRAANLPGSEGLLGPEWSPDGRYILAKSGDEHRVMLFDVGDKKWSELAHAELVTNLRWSRDANYVYFEQTSAKDAVLVRMGVKDHKSDRVMDFKDIRRPLITLSSAWSGFSDDGSPLFQRDLGTQEVYELEWNPG